MKAAPKNKEKFDNPTHDCISQSLRKIISLDHHRKKAESRQLDNQITNEVGELHLSHLLWYWELH